MRKIKIYALLCQGTLICLAIALGLILNNWGLALIITALEEVLAILIFGTIIEVYKNIPND